MLRLVKDGERFGRVDGRQGWARVQGLLEDLRYDLRDAGRSIRRNPMFAIVAVTCLSLAIATNTTIFSVFEAMLLRPFPFDEPDELVDVMEYDRMTDEYTAFTYIGYVEMRRQTQSFSNAAAYTETVVAFTDQDEPELVTGQTVTWNLFSMLGIEPQLGRLFRAEDDVMGAPGTVLLSDAVWRRRYATDSTVIGRVINLNNLPYTVIGVMAERFRFPAQSELWLPMGNALRSSDAELPPVSIVARLKPGVTEEEANAELAASHRRTDRALGGEGGTTTWIGEARPLSSTFIGEEERMITAAMMGAVTFLLLIACANVASLLLSRAAERQREFALRATLGAGRGRIVRQLLTEAIILALIAGVIAIPLAWQGMRLYKLSIPPSDPFPYYVNWSLNVPTLIYATAASLLTGILFGLVPALDASQVRPREALQEGGRSGGSGHRRHRVRNALVVGEVAIAFLLLVGASLFVRTFWGLQSVDLGYDASRIMTMRFFLPGTPYDSTGARALLVNDIVERLRVLPGVEAATVSDLIPLEDDGGSTVPVIIEGNPVEPGREPSLFYLGVAGQWFETFDYGPFAGRTFTEQELRDSIPVAVINRTMASRFWPNADPLGRRFRLAGDSSLTWFSVIGVVPDIRTVKLDENLPTPPTAYLSHRFLDTRDYGLMVRATVTPTAVTSAVQGAMRAEDPLVPVFKIWTMEEVRGLSFWMYGVWGSMFAVFGAIALFLAAIGVYGVISHGVAQRTREIGVRIALGAHKSLVIGLIVRQGTKLAGVGLLIGLVGALVLTQVVSSLLIGISPTDPVSFLGVGAFFAGVALVASLVPARRAAKLSPTVAMRHE